MFKRNGENNFIHSREIIARLILQLNATKYANLLTFKIRHMTKKKKKKKIWRQEEIIETIKIDQNQIYT